MKKLTLSVMFAFSMSLSACANFGSHGHHDCGSGECKMEKEHKSNCCCNGNSGECHMDSKKSEEKK